MATDVMLDLETLGTRPDTVILTLGAVKFNPFTDEIYGDKTLYIKPDVDEQLTMHRTIDEDTVAWWGKQSTEVYEEAMGTEGRIVIEEFLNQLCKFIVGADRIWCQGPVFDIAILENLMRQTGRPIPWVFWRIRDSRTLLQALGDSRDPNRAQAHNAMADCIYQAQAVQQAIANYGLTRV